MSRWKVLAATTPFLLIPLAFAGVSVGDGIEHRGPRPAVVLPSLVEGPQVTMRPAAAGQPDPDKGRPGKGVPGKDGPPPAQDPELRCNQDDDNDGDDGDDGDEVEVVQPCPDDLGDDDDDDDDGDDDHGDD